MSVKPVILKDGVAVDPQPDLSGWQITDTALSYSISNKLKPTEYEFKVLYHFIVKTPWSWN